MKMVLLLLCCQEESLSDTIIKAIGFKKTRREKFIGSMKMDMNLSQIRKADLSLLISTDIEFKEIYMEE